MTFSNLPVDILMALLVPFLTALATQLVIFIAQWLRKRGLDLSAEQQARLEALAQKAIAAVEEWARSQAAHGIRVPGDVKLESAATLLLQQEPKLSQSLAEAAIHSQLAMIRTAAPDFFTAIRKVVQ